MPPTATSRVVMVRRGWAVVSACAAVWLVWTALPLVERSLHTRPGDGVVDWLGARAWLAHVNVYSPEGLVAYGLLPYGFAHPPTAPFWLLPYTVFDVDMLGTMMGHTTILLLAFHLFVVATKLKLPAPVPLAALGLGLVFHASWFHDDLIMAQVSEPIAFAYLLAWLALRSEQDLAAGVAIGLACTFKPFAGVLWIMLLSLRRWRAASAAIVAWLAIAGLMTSRFGLISWLQWNDFNKQTALVWLGNVRNATLPGLILRAAYPLCRTRGATPPHLGTTVLATLLGVTLLFLCHRSGRGAHREASGEPARLDLLFAAWSTASVFVNPVAWEHYAFVLLLPIAVLLSSACDRACSRRYRVAALGAALTTGVLLSIDMHDKVTAYGQRWATSNGHLRLHLLEIANWLPWALVLVTALLLLWVRAREQGVARGSRGPG